MDYSQKWLELLIGVLVPRKENETDLELLGAKILSAVLHAGLRHLSESLLHVLD